MSTSSLQIITSATALVAVVIGPLVTLYIARKQINSSVLSKNRQEWINSLRDELSELIVTIRDLEMIMRLPREHRDAVRLMELAEKAKHKEAKVQLLINPREEDHAALVHLIQEALCLAANNQGLDALALEKMEIKIIEQSQGILKREWERVKALQ